MKFDKTHHLFPVSIQSFTADIDIDLWIQKSYEYKNQFPNSALRSNSLGYQSEDQIHLSSLFDPLGNYLIDSFEKSISKKCNMEGMWLNISPKYAYNILHLHSLNPNEQYKTKKYSGIIYLKTPPNSGNIVFYNPSNIGEGQAFSPSPNTVLVFKQDLPHRVDQNFSDEDRISLAFNFEVIL
jgi:hypothetical protein